MQKKKIDSGALIRASIVVFLQEKIWGIIAISIVIAAIQLSTPRFVKSEIACVERFGNGELVRAEVPFGVVLYPQDSVEVFVLENKFKGRRYQVARKVKPAK